MRRSRPLALFAVLTLVGIGLLAWFMGRTHVPPGAHASAASEPELAQPPPPSEPLPPPHEAATPAVSLAREEVTEPAPVTVPIDESKACVVFGRTLDENDQPLVGVAVRLHAFDVWAEGHDVPRLPGKFKLHGWEVSTNAIGEFRFEAPTPTAKVTALAIKPDDFHDSAQVLFGDGRADARPKLVGGDNDLGVFRLSGTGAIRGRVSDEVGRPLPAVELNIGNDRATTLGRNGTSDASGAYTIAHIKPGTYGVNAKCEGRLSQFKTPFEVKLGGFTDNVDFVLLAAPALSGIVVDEAGAPLQGVRLWSWPSSSGQGAGSTSGADGTFTTFLPQDEPYTLEATLKGFEPYHQHDRSVHYPPGTSGVRVEMKRASVWQMMVVDAATSQPVERFAFQVLRNNSRHSEQKVWTEARLPRMENHAGGVADVDMRPGVDTIVVSAESYEQHTVDLEPGPPPDGRIVVRMRSGASLVGRIVRGADAVPNLAVRLERGSFQRHADEQLAAQNFKVDFDDVLSATTGEDGRFRFTALERKAFRVTAAAPDGTVINVAPFRIRDDETDLGDIALEPGAAIVGQVLVPPGRSRSGLTIHLDDWRSAVTQVTNADGRFRFDALAAGTHKLVLAEVPGVLAEPEELEVALRPGETRDVVLDASDRGTCQVSLTILFGSTPAVDEEVELISPDGRNRHQLGRTDANGRVSNWAPVMGAARVSLAPRDIHGLVHPSTRLELTLDARIEVLVSFEFGSLVIELPTSVALPGKGRLEATLARERGDSAPQVLGTEVALDTGKRAWTFERVLCGEFELSVELTDSDAEWRETPLPDGSVTFAKPSIFEATVPVAIRLNETAVARLP